MNVQDIAGAIQAGVIQQDRLVKLDTPLGSDQLVVQRAVGRSRLGRDYAFTLDVVSSNDDVPLKSLIAQPVTLWFQQADQSYRPIQGHVFTARRLGADGGLTTYQLTFNAWLHLLHFRRDQKIWIDRSADAIITDVFNLHPQANGRFRFSLSQPLASRSYTRQHETDWNFVHRLLESEGLYGYWEQGSDGKSHTLVVTDTITSLPELAPAGVSFARMATGAETDALTQWSGTRTLQSVTLTTRTFDYKNPAVPANPKGTLTPTMGRQGEVPDQLEVYDYTGAYTFGDQSRGDRLAQIRMEEWESRAKRFHGAGGARALDAGRRFTLADHPVHDADPAAQREFATIEVAWWIENNLPVTGAPHFPHSLETELAEARAAAGGAAAGVAHADGSVGFYRVEVEAQRTSVPYRSPLEHHKPEMHLETAIVVGPDGEEVYTDELNRIRVRFVWDRVNPGDQGASTWVRVVQADTGGGYGGVHVPRVGEEVLIDHVGGDCDRPLAIARVYNGAVKPQWHGNGILSGHRSKEYGGSGYNQMVMDDATGQNRVQLMSSSANSLLHLGYLIDQSGNARGAYLGSGFDLRTDDYGALRASQGLYLTTHPKAAASQPLDVGETQQQLVSAESLVEAMSDASVQHQAESLQDAHDALRALTDATQSSVSGASASGGNTAGGGTGSANAFQQPVMVFGSPAGIGVSSKQSIHLAATRHLNLVSAQSTHVAAGKSLVASIGQKLSLFVQNAGMKLFAAKGKIEIQAQDDNVELSAQKTVKVLSATDQVQLAADQGILLTSGGGYIRLSGGNIEIHTPGTVDVKGASHVFAGPASMGYPLPSPRPDQPGQLELLHQYANGEAVKGGQFSVLDANGGLLRQGALDASGKTVVSGLPPGVVQVVFGKDPRSQADKASAFKLPTWPSPEDTANDGAEAGAAAQSQLGSLLPSAGALASSAGAVAKAAGSVAGAAGGAGLGGLGGALGGALGSVGSLAKASGLGGAAGAGGLGSLGSVAGMAGSVASGGPAGLTGALASKGLGAAQQALGGALPAGAQGALSQANALKSAAQQLGGLAQGARGAAAALKIV
ncbi:type VI secretion system Vgr family protein [Burkholderia plantarii]|uniref:Rhs element Vgr protein n=1 Tax=Burkholderia plantarii TaxID=41899 RepID=A0A0B6RRJ4_BURPL|nr:type VI secretion system Vgr family protein [Burkholderia plantarii]AJK46003.1 Rhs element Vgr protein [Burkholderia plantarii]